MGIQNKPFIKLIAIAVILLSAFTVVAMRNNITNFFRSANQAEVAVKTPLKDRPTNEEENKLMLEYETVLKSIDPARKEYLQKGKLSILNEADSTVQTPETAYLVCRNGNNCYYQLGYTETYNTAGLYVYVDHRVKKVLVSMQKELTGEAFVGGKVPGKKLKEEGYTISAINQGDKRKLTLLNMAHPTFKEYSITYDVTSGKVSSIFTRTTNEVDLFAKGRGKLINVAILETTDQADMHNYDPLKVIRQVGKKWELTEKFKAYDLILI